MSCSLCILAEEGGRGVQDRRGVRRWKATSNKQEHCEKGKQFFLKLSIYVEEKYHYVQLPLFNTSLRPTSNFRGK